MIDDNNNSAVLYLWYDTRRRQYYGSYSTAAHKAVLAVTLPMITARIFTGYKSIFVWPSAEPKLFSNLIEITWRQVAYGLGRRPNQKNANIKN